jgi:hypothetical protein
LQLLSRQYPSQKCLWVSPSLFPFKMAFFGYYCHFDVSSLRMPLSQRIEVCSPRKYLVMNNRGMTVERMRMAAKAEAVPISSLMTP